MENFKLIEEIQKKKLITFKTKLSGITFARVICCLLIIIFHYFCHSNGNFKFFFRTANATWGFISTTAFFCISGTVLNYNYPEIKSLKIFYYKRWRSIFPSYYICFCYFFFNNAFTNHRLFYNGHWSKLFYTLIGLDGYLYYRINTYFIIGEWFLGAIIIIYVSYPFLLWIMEKNIFIIYFIIIIFYYIMYKTNFFIIYKDTNLITCINSFYFGMISIRYKNRILENKISLLISIIIFIYLSLIKLNDFILLHQIQGYSFYIILIRLGEYIISKTKTDLFDEISKISYSLYLIHHRIIFSVLGLYNPFNWYLHLILILCTIIFSIICSMIHFIVVQSMLKSNLFKKIDSFFLS